MQLSFIKYVILIAILENILSFEQDISDYYSYGKIILYKNNTFYNSFNISIHPILNYQYLLKYNLTIEKNNANISYINDNNIEIKSSIDNNHKDFYIYFVDNEDEIIDLILNKSIDSMLSFNYLIFTFNDISENIGETLSFQILYISNISYSSMKNLLKKYNINKFKINIYYDNTINLIPNKFINISKKIPFYSIIVLLAINKIFFIKNKFYNLCLNSSILRIIFSIIYILIIKEKVKYNRNKYKYLSALTIDSYIDSMNNLINDIYLSFILTSMLFIINNQKSLLNFFNSNDKKIKIYFGLFLFLSLINVPNYLFNKNDNNALIDVIFLNIKKIIYELLKILIFIYFIKKQIKIISQVLFYYSLYHIQNNFKYLTLKKLFYKNIRFVFLVLLIINIYLNKFRFKKYKNNLYYLEIIDKCLEVNLNSCIIFIFWFLLNITEEENPILLILYKKRNIQKKNFNIYKFEFNNEITNYNYSNIKSNFNIAIYNRYPLVVLNPFITKIKNSNFEKVSIGTIE